MELENHHLAPTVQYELSVGHGRCWSPVGCDGRYLQHLRVSHACNLGSSNFKMEGSADSSSRAGQKATKIQFLRTPVSPLHHSTTCTHSRELLGKPPSDTFYETPGLYSKRHGSDRQRGWQCFRSKETNGTQHRCSRLQDQIVFVLCPKDTRAWEMRNGTLRWESSIAVRFLTGMSVLQLSKRMFLFLGTLQ